MATKKKITKEVKKEQEEIISSDTRSSKLPLKKIIVGLILITIAALLYVFRGFFIAATVNGQPISRMAVIAELEKQGGQRTLESMITKSLLAQEAKKKNITVSEKEVQDELKNIEKNIKDQGQTLDAVLAMQGMKKSDLFDQIRIQKTIEKMVSKDVTVTDKEVDEFIEANKTTIPADSDLDEVKKSAKENLKQQKLSQASQKLIENLQKSAKINYFVQY